MHVERVSQFLTEQAMGVIHIGYPDCYEGAHALADLAERIRADGVKKLLLVCGKTVMKHGLAAGFVEELSKRSIEVTVYDGAAPNPTISDVENGVICYKAASCDGICAFGGGSSMDCAKIIGARITNPKKSVGQLGGMLKVKKALPPLYVVPTTAGTGSEATLAAVVVNPADHHKYSVNDPALVPLAAALAPELTCSLPPFLTASCGMDALTHAVEAYTNIYGRKEAYAMAESAVKDIMGTVRRAYSNGSDLAARGVMLKASYKAGAAFTRNCVGYVHAIGHPLSGFYDLPHGEVMAALLPIILRKYGSAVTEPLSHLADVCGIGTESSGDRHPAEGPVTGRSESVETKAAAFIGTIESMNREFGIQETFDCIREEDIGTMVEYAFAEVKTYPTPLIFTKNED